MTRSKLARLLPSKDMLAISFRRFPQTVFFIILATAMMIWSITSEDLEGLDTCITNAFTLFAVISVYLSASLKLWNEEPSVSGTLKIAVSVAAYAVIAVFSAVVMYTAYKNKYESFTQEQIPIFAVTASVIVSIFILPFRKCNTDVQHWNFTVRILGAMLRSVAVSLVLMLGLFLLYESVSILFDISIGWKIYVSTAAVCMFGINMTLILMQVPSGKDKHDDRPYAMGALMRHTLHLLFVPLFSLYIIILYVYALRMLLSWQLVNGGVAMPVSVLMLGTIIMAYCIYPALFADGFRFDKRLMRLMPALVLPLLILMSVAIGRRISDYGITVPRLYLLLFNVWSYYVCLRLAAQRTQRVVWIPASGALLLLLSSVGPQSIANCTRRSLSHDVRTVLTAHNTTLPLDSLGYERFRQGISPDSAKVVTDKLVYIESFYGTHATSDLVEPDAWTAVYSAYYTVDTTVVENSFSEDYNYYHPIDMPQGYSKVQYHDFSPTHDGSTYTPGKDSMTLIVRDLDNNDGDTADSQEYHFTVSLKAIQTAANDNRAVLLQSDDGEACFALIHFGLWQYDSGTDDDYITDIEVRGLLFIR